MNSEHRVIRVAVYVQMDIDVDELEAEYGRSFTISEARQDVKDSVLGTVANALYPEHAVDAIVKSVRVQ